MHPVLKWAVFGMILCLVTVQVIEHNLPAFMAATSDQKTSQIAQDDKSSSVVRAERKKAPGAKAETRLTDSQRKTNRMSDRPVQKMRKEKSQESTRELPSVKAPEKPAQSFPAPVVLDMTPDSGLGPDALSVTEPTSLQFPSGDE